VAARWRRNGEGGGVIKLALLAAIGALLGAFIGLVLGAFIGGNFATDSELLGLRGYEGTGRLGLLLGLALGGVGGVMVARRRPS
jgi:hypothetical protein